MAGQKLSCAVATLNVQYVAADFRGDAAHERRAASALRRDRRWNYAADLRETRLASLDLYRAAVLR